MDPYGASVVFESNQNLKMDDADENKASPEETIRAFEKFIKEFQFRNTYVYR